MPQVQGGKLTDVGGNISAFRRLTRNDPGTL
jgi:hypothetical protein